MILKTNKKTCITKGDKYVLKMDSIIDYPWMIFQFVVNIKIEGIGKIKILSDDKIIEIEQDSEQLLFSNSKILCIGDNAKFSFDVINVSVADEWKDQIFVKNGKIYSKWKMPKGAQF